MNIQRIEKAIGKKLPQSYIDFLHQYPVFLTTAGSPFNTVSELTLMNNEEEIIRLNLEHNNAKTPPPNKYISIGEDGCGNYYFLNTENLKVYFLDHEEVVFVDEMSEIIDFDGTLILKANSVEEFAKELIALWS